MGTIGFLTQTKGKIEMQLIRQITRVNVPD